MLQQQGAETETKAEDIGCCRVDMQNFIPISPLIASNM